MTALIRILVADDHVLFRSGLVALLREQSDLTIVGEARSGPHAVRLAQELKPDVILMDVHMPEGSGVEALKTLKHVLGVRILMLTISDKDEDLLASIAAGADGYMLKSAEPEELCEAIRRVVAGQPFLSPEVTATVMRAAADSYSRPSSVSLSDREQQVLAALARGATTAQIAADLALSPHTIKTYVSRILEKLGAANRAEAVGSAVKLGLLHPDS